MAPDTTRAWVEIDLGALRRNGDAMRRRAGVPLLPMVKADGYGLGAVAVSRALEQLEPWGFGVATVAEGEELRAAGVSRPVVVFTPLLPDSFDDARAADLTPTFGDAVPIGEWGRRGGASWHLAIDTGMSRAGARWDEMDQLRSATSVLPPEGAFTHFHSADSDPRSIVEQEERFRSAVARLPARPRWLHAENSAAIVRRAPSPWDLARPGVFLYGVGIDDAAIRPEPVAHVRARVLEMRTLRAGDSVSYGASFRASAPTQVATAGIGYGDGVPRSFSNRARALIRGRLVPIVGTVTMDMTMLDVTDVPCAVGDVATFLGQDAGVTLDAQHVAAGTGVFAYELLTGLRGRLPRVYRDGDARAVV